MRLGTRLVVDLSILKENFKKLQGLCPKNKILFMVKADAYGHGMIPVVEYCLENNLTNEFGCATLGEAISLRKALKEYEFEIYVFSETELQEKSNHEKYIEYSLLPVLSSINELKNFFSSHELKSTPINLKFNTGMNRLGIAIDEFEQALELLKENQRSEIFHLMSHFACAAQSVEKIKKNKLQYEEFQNIKNKFIENDIVIQNTSMANSGAIEQNFSLDETHIRPGLMLYGPSSLIPQLRGKSCWKGEIISKLETTVLKTFRVKKGDPLGYGAEPCPGDGTIAILSIGYGDGFSTKYHGLVLEEANVPGRFVGRISMDMAHYLISDKNSKVEPGDRIIVWKQSQQEFLALCDNVKTIPYEVFCLLGARVPRVYSK